MIRLETKKVQYNINREAARISALSSGKIDKYEFLTGEEILLIWPKKINRISFTYSALGQTFEEQTKTIEEIEEGNRLKQLKSMENS